MREFFLSHRDYALMCGLLEILGLLASLTACFNWVKMRSKNPNKLCDSDGVPLLRESQFTQSCYWRVDEDFVRYARAACKWSLISTVLFAIASGFIVNILKNIGEDNYS